MTRNMYNHIFNQIGKKCFYNAKNKENKPILARKSVESIYDGGLAPKDFPRTSLNPTYVRTRKR